LSRPHEVLGVAPDATAKQVRQAYKRLARRVHPDRNADAGATARFVAVKAARDQMLRRIEAGIPPEPPRTGTPRAGTPRAGTPRASTPRASTPRPETIRPASGHVRPDPRSPEWEEEDLRLAMTDLWRPALYMTAALVLILAMWMFMTGLERAARVLAPGGYRPPVAVESPEEP
jgi:hypothetical protein